MIVSFLETPVLGAHQLSLVVPDNEMAPEVWYNATLSQLSNIAGSIDGVLIPYGISDSDVAYSYKAFFDHIRLHFNPDLTHAPVLVIGNGVLSDGNSEDYYSLADLDLGIEFFEGIPSDIPHSLSRPHSARLESFVASIANCPDRTGDSHDLANRWGAYCLLYALSTALPTSEARDQCLELADDLSEDRYYKKLIRRVARVPLSPASAENLSLQLALWASVVDAHGRRLKVLIVEDDLDLGWGNAYRLLLANADILTATTFDEAKARFCSDIDLVLLDVRLRATNPKASENTDIVSANDLPGIRFAKFLRNRGYRGPIVAATASTKAHTLTALLNFQINGYWVKPHPDTTFTAEIINDSVANLCATLCNAVEWAIGTRQWIDSVYSISKAATVGSHNSVGSELRRKAQAFHALFYQQFSHASESIANGLQFDLGFLVLFSMINELIFWPCEWVPTSKHCKQLEFRMKDLKAIVLTETSKDGETSFAFEPSLGTELRFKRLKILGDFPEVQVFRALLHLAGLINEEDQFSSLAKKRNKLTLIHGKVERSANQKHTTVAASDISQVLQIFTSLATALR